MKLHCASAAPGGLSPISALGRCPSTNRLHPSHSLPVLSTAEANRLLKRRPISCSRPGLRLYGDWLLRYMMKSPEDVSAGVAVEEETEVNAAEEKEVLDPSEGPTVIEHNVVPLPDKESDPLDFVKNLDLEFDSGEASTVLAYGAGAILTLWLSSAVVGVLDSLPLLPKLMEVVGLGYTVWFSYRYLIFKKNRDELFAKVEDIKEQILGPSE